MAAEAGVDDELFAMIWFGEFEEEDALYQTSVGQRDCENQNAKNGLPMRGHIYSRLAGL